MEAMEIGRVCIKTMGRETGRKCVILERVDENFVLVDSPWVKRRRCNLHHLEPTDAKIAVKQGANSADVEKALKKAKVSPDT